MLQFGVTQLVLILFVLLGLVATISVPLHLVEILGFWGLLIRFHLFVSVALARPIDIVLLILVYGQILLIGISVVSCQVLGRGVIEGGKLLLEELVLCIHIFLVREIPQIKLFSNPV